MAKLTLTQKPTFEAPVKIPVPGGKDVSVKFTFKSRTKEGFKEFFDDAKTEERQDADVVMDIASGWELEDAWDRENVATLLENYLGAGRAIISTYIAEQTGARQGN